MKGTEWVAAQEHRRQLADEFTQAVAPLFEALQTNTTTTDPATDEHMTPEALEAAIREDNNR